ncbi:MAG TPA: RDD family protein, partial [Tepidisphaeraceae bacterium]|nr:RDD family protein [Tepidisphaeraceae bacterium]
MADEWYYSERDQQRGPVSLDQLRQMAHTGELSPEHLVWTDTLPEWTAAGDLAELFQQPEFLQPPIGVATLGYQSAPQINYYNPTGAVVVYAGFWWRLLAYIIDEAILWLPNYVIQSGLELALRGGLPMPRGNSSLLPMMTVSGGFVPMVLEWLYFALMESSSWQGTVGKKICGLVVTDLSGGRISFGR